VHRHQHLHVAVVGAEHLNERLVADRTPVVINLASQEYFKSVDRRVLKARVVECIFEEWKAGTGAKADPGRYKIISFFAKRARGLMARWAVLHKAATPKALEKFDLEGYAFDAPASKSFSCSGFLMPCCAA
jgi:cytoplasmic iron level regulating protein YaaA (DUF328/UPF0246 family)